MIALLKNGEYYIREDENITDFLIGYAEYKGLNMKIFKILVNSKSLTIKELTQYINNHLSDFDYEIDKIYKLTERIC